MELLQTLEIQFEEPKENTEKRGIMYSLKDKEGTIINNVREDYFADYDCRKLIGNIDFSVAIRQDGKELFPETEYLLWAEAKQGDRHPLWKSFIQLILTIGKERTMDKNLPPKFLGAFDAEKMAFIPYSAVMEVFSQNDFNWNVTPSDHETKEFKQLKELVRAELNKSNKDRDNIFVFYFDNDKRELQRFIKKNFVSGRDSIQRIRINHNNFKAIYEKWRQAVMPTINVNWDNAKKHGLLDADFYLADVMAEDNNTLMENLHVLLRSAHYELDRQLDADGLFSSKQVAFKDHMIAHNTFWAHYARPPKREYWDKIVERRDLLVPQDVRERKGSYFTPQIWVEKSQEYLADVLGENWQDEYYIWDCCAGTGNLLAGLTNKYNIWASTLDKADVSVMHERIQEMGTGSNLLESHVFQFDFLNDEFSKLPQGLQDIINDEEKRKHLVIYINPPYAEAGSRHNPTHTGESKTGVSVTQQTYKKYLSQIGLAGRELFAQFFMRIYQEIPGARLAEFSKLKILQASNFADFRAVFKAKLEKMFMVPAFTFDNVKGKFPIGFMIWDTSIHDIFSDIDAEVYDANGNYLLQKYIAVESDFHSINDWIKTTRNRPSEEKIGWLSARGCDMQVQAYNFICNDTANIPHPRGTWITTKNISEIAIYLAVYQSSSASWINDRDQFYYPNDGWKDDRNFQSDCLAYTLFHGQNRISSEHGTNHWIPFTEQELDAPDCFQSHFMSDFIAGKVAPSKKENTLFDNETATTTQPITFTPLAAEVMEAGRKLWYYYLHHKQDSTELYANDSINVNASFYDIRRYFQGTNPATGKMNNDSPDEEYTRLLADLRQKQRLLAKQIEEKVYLYGFLK